MSERKIWSTSGHDYDSGMTTDLEVYEVSRGCIRLELSMDVFGNHATLNEQVCHENVIALRDALTSVIGDAPGNDAEAPS